MHDCRVHVARVSDASRPTHHGIAVPSAVSSGGVGVREHNPFAAAIMLAYYVVDSLSIRGFHICEFAGHRRCQDHCHGAAAVELSRHLDRRRAGKPTRKRLLCRRARRTFSDKLSDKWPAFIWPKVKMLYYIFRSDSSRSLSLDSS